MDLRQHMSRWNGKMTKEKWLFLLFIGVVLMILAFPVGKGGGSGTAVFSKQKDSGAQVSERRTARLSPGRFPPPPWRGRTAQAAPEGEAADRGEAAAARAAEQEPGLRGAADKIPVTAA